jgi:hypothetical protein
MSSKERYTAADRVAAAAYIAELSGDLAMIARGHGLTTLGYLLEMARMEAQSNTRPDCDTGAGALGLGS